MIGRVAGRVAYKADDHVVIDTGGVGYVVQCSDRTLAALPPAGGAAALWTDLLVREDLLQLYGFLTLAEKEWHRLLMSVQGVGAKASLAILGTLGADGIGRAIALGDANAIKAARGIGPKTAQRVVNELRDKAHGVMALAPSVVADADAPSGPVSATAPAAVTPPPADSTQADTLSALANLGYAPADAARAVAQARDDAPEADMPALIRAALKRLAPGG